MNGHGDCRVYNKNGELIRTEKMSTRYAVKFDGAWFRCHRCNHTLNLKMKCEQCAAKRFKGEDI